MSNYYNNMRGQMKRKKEMAKTLVHVSRPKRKKPGLLKAIRTGRGKAYYSDSQTRAYLDKKK